MMMMMFHLSLFVLLAVAKTTLGQGSSQSPIDIVTHETKDVDLGPLEFTFEEEIKPNAKFVLYNDGKGFSVTGENMEAAHLHGGGLFKGYKFAQFHMHWGWDNNTENNTENWAGSEHTIDGSQSAGELHMVFYRDTFANIGAAIESQEYDALAVVGVLIETKGLNPPGAPGRGRGRGRRAWRSPEQIAASQTRREALFRLLADNLMSIQEFEQETEVSASDYTIVDLLPEDTDHFYSYEGSLTTPGYEEVVAWRVFAEAVELPRSTLNRLFNLIKDMNNETVTDNYRPTMPVGDRTVYFHTVIHQDATPPVADEQCVVVPKSRIYNCRRDYVDAISRALIEEVYIPQCESDNKYSKIQCFKQECWCADMFGEQIGKRVPLNKAHELDCDSIEVRGRVSCRKMRENAIANDADFIPECDDYEGGIFKEEQCFDIVGNEKFCWCSLTNGARLPGTLTLSGSDDYYKTNCNAISDLSQLCTLGKLGYFSHPEDCRFYTFCLADEVRVCTCPEGKFFNPFKKECEFKKTNNNCDWIDVDYA